MVMCGVPGSGKSTWIKNRSADTNYIHCSRDKIRFSLLKDKDNYFTNETLVFNLWVKEINKAIQDKIKNIYIDATHLNEKSRNKILNKLNLNEEVDIIPVNFIIPLNVCLERNTKRSGREYVPEDVIKNMFKSFKPASHNEKYDYALIMNIRE